MFSFSLYESISSLREQYPDPKALKAALIDSDEGSRNAIARLWISEGIPKAFVDRPAIYESLREWLGKHLEVHPKHISITGSGRLGYSLANYKFGQEFSNNSDIDLFVVSETLFELLKKDFFLWADHYDKKIVIPNRKQIKLWPSNKKYGTINIDRGFIDSNKIPSENDYVTNKRILQTMFLLVKKLEKIEEAPNPKKASIRCYRNWDSAIKQISFNLSHLV